MITIAPNFTQKEYRWTAWKTCKSKKGFLHQHDEDGELYFVYGYDGPEVHLCKIYKGEVPQHVVEQGGYTQEQNDLDKADFIANFQASSNKAIVPTDTDGSALQRPKATFSGWQYRVHGLEYRTCKPGSVVETDEAGTPFNFSTIKFYNDANVELTDEAEIQNTETGAVKTVIDWEPNHDIEILGGRGKQLVKPSVPVRVWVRAVPGIPSIFGGNKLFVSCINLQYVGVDASITSDGRAPKLLKYDANLHTNLIRFIVIHPKGFQHDMSFWMEFFRP